MRNFPEWNILIPVCAVCSLLLTANIVCMPLHSAKSAPVIDSHGIIYTDMPIKSQYNISRIERERPDTISSKFEL